MCGLRCAARARRMRLRGCPGHFGRVEARRGVPLSLVVPRGRPRADQLRGLLRRRGGACAWSRQRACGRASLTNEMRPAWPRVERQPRPTTSGDVICPRRPRRQPDPRACVVEAVAPNAGAAAPTGAPWQHRGLPTKIDSPRPRQHPWRGPPSGLVLVRHQSCCLHGCRRGPWTRSSGRPVAFRAADPTSPPQWAPLDEPPFQQPEVASFHRCPLHCSRRHCCTARGQCCRPRRLLLHAAACCHPQMGS